MLLSPGFLAAAPPLDRPVSASGSRTESADTAAARHQRMRSRSLEHDSFVSVTCIFDDRLDSVRHPHEPEPTAIPVLGATRRARPMIPIDPEHLLLLEKFSLNLTASAILLFAIFYPRYRDKELAISGALFNLFIFAVLTVLNKVEFSLAAGFGLFAILAMFTLRSEPLSKIEITYFFGSVAIAVICSVKGTSMSLVSVIVGVVVLGAWAIDHPKVLSAVDRMRVTLDRIDPDSISDPVKMRAVLGERLGVDVLSYQVTGVDYIADSARVNVFYRRVHHGPK
jgi:Domain of unknown function (DUF4956)